jgi:DNA invertase Pin-like site-specific DNA recombinase
MSKTIIYLRTSTKDQHPELQEKDCRDFAKRIGLEVVEIVSEQGSAYKLESIRPKWEYAQERAKKEKLDIILWRYDRSFRNRADFFKFMKVMFEVYGKRVYSVTEPSILSFWDMMSKNHSDNPVFNELLNGIFKAIWDFMIQQAGEEAEQESKKKSDRVKLAVRTENGITKSYKGNKWGRKSRDLDKKIIELINKGLKYREIQEQVFYYDKNNHKKNVSLGYVSKIVHKLSSNKLEDRKIAKVDLTI